MAEGIAVEGYVGEAVVEGTAVKEVGPFVGTKEGAAVGVVVGFVVGSTVGLTDPEFGATVGLRVPLLDGYAVG